MHSNALTDGLLSELVNEENLLSAARRQLHEATIQYEVAVKKYAAVRDMVTDYLGRSPYKAKDLQWPNGRIPNGHFRFMNMSPGDAIVFALKEVDDAMGLNELLNYLVQGGLYSDSRKVNAALMQKAGIIKDADDKYRYEDKKKEDGKEDLPW